MTRYDTTRHDTTPHDTTPHDRAHDTTRHGHAATHTNTNTKSIPLPATDRAACSDTPPVLHVNNHHTSQPLGALYAAFHSPLKCSCLTIPHCHVLSFIRKTPLPPTAHSFALPQPNMLLEVLTHTLTHTLTDTAAPSCTNIQFLHLVQIKMENKHFRADLKNTHAELSNFPRCHPPITVA